jgi:hypothetical protein
MKSRRDERDTLGLAAPRQLLHPLGAGARLARATAAEEEPGAPIGCRRQLFLPGPQAPISDAIP